MKRGKFFFITGGARSGKSHFAETLAQTLGENVTYIATAEVRDEEMRERIKEHRKKRPPSWSTIEEPQNVSSLIESLGDKDGVIIIDCLTLLISNLLFENNSEPKELLEGKEAVLKEVERLALAARDCRAHVIIVSNEVGLGIVPPFPQARLFRDIAGWANQVMAAEADEVYFLITGLAVELKALQSNFHQNSTMYN